jgi:DNA-binding transcriptional MerR regulator
MSDSAETLQEMRDRGSLRYLAFHLRVTTKQVTRYWDAGWIPGSSRTPNGHRRIRYTDDTVEQVAFLLKHRKKEPAIGLLRDLIWAIKGTSQKEVTDWERTFGDDRLDDLIYEHVAPPPGLDSYSLPRDGKDFRVRAHAALEEILSEINARAGWDGFSRSSPEGESLREKRREYFRALLLQPDVESFELAWKKATELSRRLMHFDEPTVVAKQAGKNDGEDRSFFDEPDDAEATNREGTSFERAMANVKTQPRAARLQIAALSLKHRDMPTTAAALARELGISRRALYHTYGKEAIQDALKMVRNDVLAKSEERKEAKAKAKKTDRFWVDQTPGSAKPLKQTALSRRPAAAKTAR